MQLRRTLATGTLLVALAAPLTACGFDYATDRYYTPAAGANDRDGVVDVLGAVIVSGEEGSGTFIASLSNNDVVDEHTLTGIAGTGDPAATAEGFEPVTVEPDQLVNLAEPPAEIVLTGDFAAGNFVELTLTFDTDEITLNVPVVEDAGDYAGLDAS